MPSAQKSIIRRFTGSETSQAVGSEIIITGVPDKGYITRIHAVKTGGSASNIQPCLGRGANPEGTLSQILLAAASGGLHIDEVPTSPIPFKSNENRLYLRLKPDSASDNAISWELFIKVAI